jgi:hypothetical protein
MNNRIKMTDSKFKCNIFLFLSVTVFMARLSMYEEDLYVNTYKSSVIHIIGPIPRGVHWFSDLVGSSDQNSHSQTLLVIRYDTTVF